jgi:uncharacterized damage-inducible protein DinB
MRNELEDFCARWIQETSGTLALLRALPVTQYDFRPDAGGRSLGELAWHLAEVDAYVTFGIARGAFRFEVKPPHIARPKDIPQLALAFEIVHDDAVARIAELKPSDLDREIPYIDGTSVPVRDLLWRKLLLHAIHHRGQLMLLCRLAGGIPPALFGPTREHMAPRPAVGN